MRRFHNVWTPVPKPDQVWRRAAESYPYLDIEVGAGVGYHAIQYARAHPDRFLIAIEKTSEKFTKFQNRLNHHEPIPNLFALQANAIQFIAQNIGEEEVNRYFILYPNPYPKAKQKNKRFMHMPFMYEMIKTLRSKGELTLSTNMSFYYEEAKQVLREVFEMRSVQDEKLPFNFTPRTHFEKKYLARGEECFNIIFRK